jgi:biopolymer transport protein ExbD
MASSKNGDDYEISGINVTPLVDIMLVLLIIFLVTATYIVKEAIKIDLPRAAAAGGPTPRTLTLAIAKDGQVFLDGVASSDAAIVRKLGEERARKQDLQAVIAADRDARHGAVVHVLDLLRGQGVTKFAIEVQKEQAGAP